MVTSPARRADADHLPSRLFSLTDDVRGGIPVQLRERRVLHPGRWRWLRPAAWLVVVFVMTAAAFGLPLQAAVDRPPHENGALQLAGLVLACAASTDQALRSCAHPHADTISRSPISPATCVTNAPEYLS